MVKPGLSPIKTAWTILRTKPNPMKGMRIEFGGNWHVFRSYYS